MSLDSEGASLGNLGNTYAALGDDHRAIECYRQTLSISQEMGDVLTAAMNGANLGVSLAQVGQIEEAIMLVKRAIHDFQHAGYPQQAQQAERMLTQLQGSGAYVPAQASPTLAAVTAFQQAGSLSEMQTAVALYPFMTEKGFIQALTQQVRPEHQPAYQQRLTWLKQLANQKQPGLLSRLFGKKR